MTQTPLWPQETVPGMQPAAGAAPGPLHNRRLWEKSDEEEEEGRQVGEEQEV